MVAKLLVRYGLSGVLACAGLLASQAVLAHAERQSFFPQDRITSNPHPARKLNAQGQPQYRPLLPTPASPRLVVCKKPGNEGVGPGESSASRIATMQDAALKSVNQKLLGECAFEHLQAAVDAVTTRGTTIYVLPGRYLEQPSVRALDERAGASTPADTTFCQAVLARGGGALSYEEQYRCRHIQNTVAIFGDPNFTDDDCGNDLEGVCTHPETQACNPAQSACQYYDLQVEGTGEHNYDVIFEGDFITNPGDPADGQFRYLNGIRADRADGIYLRNFTTQIFEFNSVYVEETDGFVLDQLLARWVDEYSFLTFASDHGLYNESGGYGAADSVIYPGSGADIYKDAQHSNANLRARQGTEIRNSFSTHAAAGYSGTAGNSPWVHDNVFRKNQMGLVTESIFGGHPGMPQDHGLYEDNLIYANNKNYFGYIAEDGVCITQTPRDRGVVPPEWRELDHMPPEVQEAILDRMVLCPAIPFPSGVGMLIGGGNYDVTQNNTVFDNWKQAFMLFHAPAALRSTFVNNMLSGNPEAMIRGVTQPIDTDPLNPFDNSHFNRYLGNRFAENVLTTPHRLQPNGVDFWYDNSGVGNCWRDNTSFSPDGVSFDTGDPLHDALGLPSDCLDGPIPGTVEQIAAENPLRISFLASCILYSRNDPSSKSPLCPFFELPVAPAGRQGETTAIASRPLEAQAASGQTVKSGYFVLNNDTGATHTVTSVTVAAEGALSRLSGLKLSVTTTPHNGRKTVSAELGEVGNTNVFTFAEPAVLNPQHYVLFELEATVAGGNTAFNKGSGGLLLAAGGGSALFGLVLLVGGTRRRYTLALLAALAAGLLVSCGGDNDNDEAAGTPVTFKAMAVEANDSAGAVSYAGLPLSIGTVRVR